MSVVVENSGCLVVAVGDVIFQTTAVFYILGMVLTFSVFFHCFIVIVVDFFVDVVVVVFVNVVFVVVNVVVVAVVVVVIIVVVVVIFCF